ncbi:MAG TPA: hypothetical protein VE032_07200 [Actinomycetota bacterium]|nr:hypothetical protein [Actinomycetota bacterium]
MADTGSGASNGMAGRVLAVIIAVGAIAVAATTGDSWAVRTTLVLVAGDVAVRLWRWGS